MMKFLSMNVFAYGCHSDVFSAVTLQWTEATDTPREPYYQLVAANTKVREANHIKTSHLTGY
jgi:hypothetical protein